MSVIENFSEDARQIEQEITRMGIALGVDWDDDAAVRALAREALDHKASAHHGAATPREQAKGKLFGLAALMLRTMQDSADIGIHTHGGPAWKALGRAMYQEADLRKWSQ